jgi:hypothetical protein
MPRTRMSTFCAIATLLALGCNLQPQQQSSKTESKTDTKAEPKANDADKKCAACALFTEQDVQLMLGARVSPGKTNDTTCKWTVADDDKTYLSIRIDDDTHYWPTDLSTFPEYQEAKGVGKKAFAFRYRDGGYAGMALTEKQVVMIIMRGGSSSRDAATAALRTVLDRLAKNNK